MLMKDAGVCGCLPASDPGEERGIMLGSEHISPEVGTSGGRDCREDLGHAGAYDDCY